MEDKDYRRKTREVPQEVRNNIAAKLRGRKKTPEHCRNISSGLRSYWSKIPKASSNGTTTIEDLI